MIKKYTLPALVVALALGLGACNDASNSSNSSRLGNIMDSERVGITVNSVVKGSSYSQLGLWTDPTTGCEYYTGETKAGIFMTPKIGADRMPICDKAKSSDYETYNRLKKQFESE